MRRARTTLIIIELTIRKNCRITNLKYISIMHVVFGLPYFHENYISVQDVIQIVSLV